MSNTVNLDVLSISINYISDEEDSLEVSDAIISIYQTITRVKGLDPKESFLSINIFLGDFVPSG